MNHKILVVDDEPDTLSLLEYILNRKGYNIETTLSGHEALKKLRKEKFDLILIDILMPGMNGVELAGEIRNNPGLKDIKIIFLTVLNALEYARRYGTSELKELNISAHITKPFDNKHLTEVIDKILST